MAQFNLRVGATPVPTTGGFGEIWKRKFFTARAQLRAEPLHFFRTLVPRITVFSVYATETSQHVERSPLHGVVFRSVVAEELIDESRWDDEFGQRQRRLLERFGEGNAFAARVDEKLAHVSWLMTAPLSLRDEILVLRLKHDEAEITGCETKEEFRRQGLYRYVIRELIFHSQRLGVRRVLMKTAWNNVASQNGIKSAGLTFAGIAIVVNVPGRNIKPIVLTLVR